MLSNLLKSLKKKAYKKYPLIVIVKNIPPRGYFIPSLQRLV